MEREDCEKQLKDSEEPNIKIQYLCIKLTDPKLTNEDKRKYLEELQKLSPDTEFQNDVKSWLDMMRPSDYKVSDTDDPNHLFLIGEEVSGSCQHITTGNPKYNCGLLGYLLNGYNRAVVVTDKDGCIVARTLLRLYWDGDKPVLYQDRYYTRNDDPKMRKLVDEMCKRRAKAMNLDLVGAEDNGKPYPKPLQALGGNADIEYVDAIGGIHFSEYKFLTSYLMQSAV